MEPPVPLPERLPPQPMTTKLHAARMTNPKVAQPRRRGTANSSRQPSASPPSRSPNSRPSLADCAVVAPVVFTVRVAFTGEDPATEAVVGTTHVGATLEDVPPDTAQLSWTVPVNPPAGLMVSVSATDWPAIAMESVLLPADSPKVGDAGICWMLNGTVSVCWMAPETAVTATL